MSVSIDHHRNKQEKLPAVLVELLKKRGIEDINEFLCSNLNKLPDLTKLLDLQKASQRIIEAIDKKEKIAVYGDYDVDGTTSCALLFHFFKLINIDIDCIQPSRFIEGYGIHPPTIDQAIEENIKVLITVDCGISNNETADYAKEKGIDLIITDHHKDAREEMPKAYAIINPNRRDEDLNSHRTALAGVGVAFALSLQIKNDLKVKGIETPSIYPLLQFVAIGTICDMAYLNPMNLKLTRHGLAQIPQTKYAGIKCFFPPEERASGNIPSDKISFNVGPMINSKGRLDHPKKALELLISDDISYAFECYSMLEVANKERKTIQHEVFEEAKQQVISNDDTSKLINIVYAPNWHEGVIGIVASKLVETFKVPAIVFTDSSEEGVIKASIRSAGELNIFEALNNCSELFIKFGGHKAAAGLSMNKENLDQLKNKLDLFLKDIPEIVRTKQSRVDLEIKPGDITPNLVKALEKIGPFSIGNEVPIFKMSGVRLDSYDILKDVHVRWSFSSIKNPQQKLKGISFNYVGAWNKVSPEAIFEEQSLRGNELVLTFSLGINRWKGREYIQLMIEEVTLSRFE